ncbi:uncharacterized protein BO95DRAFT_493471 [Aspergillus brunneoviolaceus CBS 621.78]|uniref:Uncharacterized protein n=1 Tax=Aspergillus brunneoviolaceus CBS 621.78 TaxID=1450534 RepID=A0ACD1GDD3_9EURO|nr:hypothetical protein BO95DRAFT_493471 [Aspergillus brunneoviolaceus CBS 621.78]RAH47222.1 hypothetical protein BO95DRAFT_493471 [Aspergillus brunneoviolaceus CBS 621.78]
MVQGQLQTGERRSARSRKDRHIHAISRPEVRWHEIQYPDPELRFEKLAVETLPDPPKDFTIGGKRSHGLTKGGHARKEDLEMLLQFLDWGFDHDRIIHEATCDQLGAMIFKLIFNRAPEHRPQTWNELFDVTRDAGPRLLSRAIDRPCIPVSRYYPSLKNGPAMPAGRIFQRPLDASPYLSDLCIHRMSLPSTGGSLSAAVTPQPNTPNENTISLNSSPSHSSSLPATQLAIQLASTESMTNSHNDPSNKETLSAQSFGLPQAALVDSAQTNEACLSRGATDHAIMHGTSPDNNITIEEPVPSVHSSMLDALIVVAQLLKLGSSKDKSNESERQTFDGAELAFREAISQDWDTCAHEEGARLITRLKAELEKLNVSVATTSQNVRDAWMALTKSFTQFDYLSAKRYSSCSCLPDDLPGSPFVDEGLAVKHHIFMPLAESADTDGVTIQDLLGRWFGKRWSEDCVLCKQPGSVATDMAFQSTPLCLVVAPAPGTSLHEHTRDISINYIDFTGTECTASYRWTGGIYYNNSRLRVYWTDTKVGEQDSGNIRAYESRLGSVFMVESHAQSNPFDRVPPVWWENKPVPLLFYECTWRPESEHMERPTEFLDDMLAALDDLDNQLVTQATMTTSLAVPALHSQLMTPPTTTSSPESHTPHNQLMAQMTVPLPEVDAAHSQLITPSSHAGQEELQYSDSPYGYGFGDFIGQELFSVFNDSYMAMDASLPSAQAPEFDPHTEMSEADFALSEGGFEELLNNSTLQINWSLVSDEPNPSSAESDVRHQQESTDIVMQDVFGGGETDDSKTVEK